MCAQPLPLFGCEKGAQVIPFPPESYVDAVAASRFLGVSVKHVLRLARQGIIPAHPAGQGTRRQHWRFLLSELDEWMRSRHNPPVHQRRSEGE